VYLLCLTIAALLTGAWLAPARLDPRRLRERAAEAVKAKRFEEADAALKRLPSRRAMDWVLQSKIDLALGHPESALADLRHVADSDRLGSLARYSEGLILLDHLHRSAAGEIALRRAIDLEPTAAQTRQKLCSLYYTLSMRAEYGAQFRALEAMGQFGFDDVYHACIITRRPTDTRQVVKRLREFLAADQGDRRCRLALAEELRVLNELAEAEDVLGNLSESDAQAQALRAHLALDRSDLGAAESLLRGGPPDDPDFAALRGRVALAKRRVSEAVREFRIAVAAHPDQRDVLLGLGRALRLAGDNQAAEPYLHAAANRDHLALLLQDLVAPGATRDSRLLQKLGVACERVQLYAEARGWYRLALSYDPSNRQIREDLERVRQREA
jgi:tetratricopeptide (TPR) repeat protein